MVLDAELSSPSVNRINLWINQKSTSNFRGAFFVEHPGLGREITVPDSCLWLGKVAGPITFAEREVVIIGNPQRLAQLDLAVLRDIGFETNDFDGPVILGDVNLDDAVSFQDISPFISVLSIGGFQAEADVNRNGYVDSLDINPFVVALSSQ